MTDNISFVLADGHFWMDWLQGAVSFISFYLLRLAWTVVGFIGVIMESFSGVPGGGPGWVAFSTCIRIVQAVVPFMEWMVLVAGVYMACGVIKLVRKLLAMVPYLGNSMLKS